MKEVISIWTHDWNFLERRHRSINAVQCRLLPRFLEANNSNTKNCQRKFNFHTLICGNSFQIWNNVGTVKFRSFQLTLSASKSVVSYQSLCLLNSVARTNFISFLIDRPFYFLELQLINSRKATVLLLFVLRTVSSNTFCFEIWSSNVTFDQICHCPAQEPIKLLFQIFARYFTFLPAISIRTARQLANQIWETMHSM